MGESVFVALIAGGLSLAGVIITAIVQAITTSKKLQSEFQKQTAEIHRQSEIADLKLQAKLENFQSITNEKIDELAKRVESHNKIVDRTYKLEQDGAVMLERLKRTDRRLEDLEHMGA